MRRLTDQPPPAPRLDLGTLPEPYRTFVAEWHARVQLRLVREAAERRAKGAPARERAG